MRPNVSRRRHEMHFGAAAIGGAGDRQRRHGDAVAELHLVRLAVAPDAKPQPVGQRVDDGNADAVQAARHLVAVLVELAAGVKLGHHDLGGRALELVVVLEVDRDAAAVVDDGHRIVGVDDDLDVVAVSRPAPRRSRCRAPRTPCGGGPCRPTCRRCTCPGACARRRGPSAPGCCSNRSLRRCSTGFGIA